jgi:hypothetical protein
MAQTHSTNTQACAVFVFGFIRQLVRRLLTLDAKSRTDVLAISKQINSRLLFDEVPIEFISPS